MANPDKSGGSVWLSGYTLEQYVAAHNKERASHAGVFDANFALIKEQNSMPDRSWSTGSQSILRFQGVRQGFWQIVLQGDTECVCVDWRQTEGVVTEVKNQGAMRIVLGFICQRRAPPSASRPLTSTVAQQPMSVDFETDQSSFQSYILGLLNGGLI